MFATIDELPDGSTAVVRVDLNSPIEDGEVQDNRRFARHAETIRALCAADHRVVTLAHQGRPGRPDCTSLDGHARILASRYGLPIDHCPETIGETAREAVTALSPGEAVLLENVRMHPAELADRTPAEHASGEFVTALAALGDGYVGDAYSVAHRAQASVVGLPLAMDAYAGPVMLEEYRANAAIQDQRFDGPVVMVLGGTKVPDLLRVIRGVGDRVDTFLLGGVIGELCLRAEGYDLGYDVGDEELFDPLWEEHAEELAALLDAEGDRLELPTDLSGPGPDSERVDVEVGSGPKSRPYYDVGPTTIGRYDDVLAGADAAFVKGGLGVFEDERFADGTVSCLRTIAASDAFSVVGGGDTARAIELYDLDRSAFDHVSIAGGAYVRALAGESLPGVEALTR